MDIIVGKNIFFTSMSIIIQAVFTFVFWLVIAKVAGAEAMGFTNAIISLVTIIVSFDVVNTHLGMKRYLGIAKSSGDLGKFKRIVILTIAFVSTTVMISAVLIASPNLQIMDMVGFDRGYTWIVISIIPAFAFNIVFPEVLIAAGESKKLAKALIIGSLARFPVLFGTAYILNAPLNIATIISYSCTFFITPALCFMYLRKVLRVSTQVIKNARSDFKQILGAGLASWIPTIISVLGSQLGIITVFAIQGATEAGKFYLPMTIFTIVLFIVNGINRVSHPLVAGMSTEQEQTNFVSYSLKIAYILTLPFAIPLLYFASNFLGLIGSEFASAGSTLTILMMALPLSIISEVVYYFMYSRGDKRAVLYLGLVGNSSRIVLYFVLVPLFGTDGAAMGYLFGSLIQFVFSLRIGRQYSLIMHHRNYVLLTLIPLAIGGVMWLINVQFVIATAVIILGSLLLYVRLHLFTDNELRNVLYASLPNDTARKIYPKLSMIMYKIS